MTMKPYFEISKDPKDMGVYSAQFEGMDKKTTITEYYCVNPRCDCTEVLLVFDEEIGESRHELLMRLRLERKTWEVAGVDVKSPKAERLRMDENFMRGLDSELKAKMEAHAKAAKQYAAESGKAVDAELVRSGVSVGYSEVFEDNRQKMFRLERDGRMMFADDAYCMNPKCDCRKLTLSFLDIGSGSDGRLLFAGQYDLKKRKFEFVERRCSQGEAEGAVEALLRDNSSLHALLAERYDRMKEAGRRAIAEERQTLRAEQAKQAPSAGRNDPCPCGSGKKYKRCCR